MHPTKLAPLRCSLQDLVGNVIPNTLEKIFPSGDPNIKDYAAARRIPYLVTFGQLALPLMFQWVSLRFGSPSAESECGIEWSIHSRVLYVLCHNVCPNAISARAPSRTLHRISLVDLTQM
jgi:hypothetical protein